MDRIRLLPSKRPNRRARKKRGGADGARGLPSGGAPPDALEMLCPLEYRPAGRPYDPERLERAIQALERSAAQAAKDYLKRILGRKRVRSGAALTAHRRARRFDGRPQNVGQGGCAATGDSEAPNGA
jgi:hypothetical protein